MEELEDAFVKEFKDIMEQVFNEANQRHEELLEKAKKSIKHPLWQYATVDYETGQIELKRKSFKLFWKTFGKKVVAVKIQKLRVEPLEGDLL